MKNTEESMNESYNPYIIHPSLCTYLNKNGKFIKLYNNFIDKILIYTKEKQWKKENFV